MNIVVLKVTEDWIIDENRKNIILQYNQTVSSPLTKPVRNAFIQSDFANIIVGNLTKADFAYPGGCTRQCHALEKDFAFKHHHRMDKKPNFCTFLLPGTTFFEIYTFLFSFGHRKLIGDIYF